MRILIHDFGGYAFPLQLSRQLVKRGHDVCHAYCASLTTTPPGVAPSDNILALKGLRTARPFDKYNFVRRWQQEHEYGRLIREVCVEFEPDIVLSGNAPLPAQQMLVKLRRQHGFRFVFWLQDLLGLAALRILKSRQWILGVTVGRYFEVLERQLLQKSDAVVSICDDFVPLLTGMGVRKDRIEVIENWGVLPKGSETDSNWAATHVQQGRSRFLYTGTLSLKHNPILLLRLAQATVGHAEIVVISQGIGAEWLQEKKALFDLPNLIVLPYQDAADLPAIYASADMLMALLTRDAGVFSVPSKVLTYLCAGKPVLAAMPPENLAARILQSSGAGRVTPPGDVEAFVEEALTLMDDPSLRSSMGVAAKAYAERQFDIDRITDRFEDVFRRVLA